MRNSLARSLSTWRIHDKWLCEKPWMNRISAPAGLPHSCAEMVRPSGVFTAIGLYFRSCPKPGCATVANKSGRDRHFDEATIANGYRHRTPPLFFVVSQASTCVKRVKVGQGRGLIGWAEMHPTDIPKYTAGGGCNQQVVQCSSAYSIKTTAGLIHSANNTKT